MDFGLSTMDMTAADAWGQLVATLADHGFGRCLYGYVPDRARLRSDEAVQDVMTFMTTYDEEFLTMYRRHQVHLHCASVTYVTQEEAPTLMAPIIAANLIAEPLPQIYRDWLRRYNKRTNAFDGVLVPLRGPVYCAIGGASTLVEPSMDAAEASRHARRHLGIVGELINIFHQNLEFSSLLPLERHLTPREAEILRWLAEGLLTKQIAARTGTSVSTIEKQLSSARRRLAAGNNTNLLLKAMAYDLL